ncbi:MAG: SpoIID/LytB domain-containing protein [Armatimonadetes bacterium]|nr:SpoIID/LytB domain-containing protein [Armatimonadota bacterium]
MRRCLLLLLAGTVAAAGPALAPGTPAQGSTNHTVRVGILLNQDAILVQSDGALEAGDVTTQSVTALPAGAFEFRPSAQGIDGGIHHFGAVVRLRPAAGWLQVGSRRYRGLIELRRTPAGRLTAINEIDLEQYLYGVLKMEVDARWPPEALKAQAVAARTLALQSLGRFAAEGYDLRATTESQVYAGINAEDPRTTAAVDATRGLIMTYGGRPIFAAYHSDSGGATESSEFVWGQPYAYLRGVADPFGRDAPAREWLSRIDLPTLEARLARAGRPLPSIAAIEITATTPSGRAATVRITGAGGALDLRGTELRQILGVSFLRSTLFAVRVVGDNGAAAVEFTGRGSGHGVGLSQWGARGQALAGRTYAEILQFYYQGIQLEVR